MRMSEDILRATVTTAYGAIERDAAHPSDHALVHCFEAVTAMMDRVDELNRVIELYKTTTKSELPHRMAELQGENKMLGEALDLSKVKVDALANIINERASSHRWDTICRNHAIYNGDAVDENICEYVQTLLAAMVRH